MKYYLRFFVNGDENVYIQFEYDYPPVIPHKHELVNFDDSVEYCPYEVTNVEYFYPSSDLYEDFVLIDVSVEEVCE